MNRVCCKALSAAGVRTALGLSLDQKQWFPMSHAPRCSFPYRHRKPSLITVQYSTQEPALLKTTGRCSSLHQLHTIHCCFNNDHGSIIVNCEVAPPNEEDAERPFPVTNGSATNGSLRRYEDEVETGFAQELEDTLKAAQERFIDAIFPRDVVFQPAAVMIHHPEKNHPGEDAYFIDGTRWIGVADGEPGPCGRVYASEIMEHCGRRLKRLRDSTDPKAVLADAARRAGRPGQATAVIASLFNRKLRVANIGNSGFIVVRDSTIIARSKPMFREFAKPVQIGNGTSAAEVAKMAEVYEVSVELDDIVILASDGIWDNLFEKQVLEVVEVVRENCGGRIRPGVLAHDLVVSAYVAGQQEDGTSPFAEAARAEGYSRYYGGKPDDTTAVVALVT